MSVTQPATGLIDLHAHFTTDSYIEQAKAAGHRDPDGMPEAYWPVWRPEDHLAVMERAGIDRAVLSISSPGVYFGDPTAARALAREVNLAGAEQVADHPGRFGLFASLPLPDIDGSLSEIEYMLDHAAADGFVLMTNSAGRYLGSPDLQPVLAELDRRASTVLLHPNSCPGYEALSIGRPRPMIEFLFDTARTVLDYVLSGAASRYRHLTVIVPHAGGVLPLLADRVELFRTISGEPADRESTTELLARMYFDLAGVPSTRQLSALTSLVPMEQLVYGSDYVWTRPEPMLHALEVLDTVFAAAGVADWRDLTSQNARRLLAGTGQGAL